MMTGLSEFESGDVVLNERGIAYGVLISSAFMLVICYVYTYYPRKSCYLQSDEEEAFIKKQ